MHIRTIARLLVTIFVLWLTGDFATGQQLEPRTPIVPVYEDPHHRQVFQSGPWRIIDVQLPPNDTTWWHTHYSPVLYLTLSSSTIEERIAFQIQGGDWIGKGAQNLTPEVLTLESFTNYVRQPEAHYLQNIGDGLYRAIVVVNETTGDNAASPSSAGFDSRPVLTNNWFRAYRIALGSNHPTESHLHRTPVAILQATSGAALGVGARTWEFNTPGQWAFFDPGEPHELRVTGRERVEFIEVEVRGR